MREEEIRGEERGQGTRNREEMGGDERRGDVRRGDKGLGKGRRRGGDERRWGTWEKG